MYHIKLCTKVDPEGLKMHIFIAKSHQKHTILKHVHNLEHHNYDNIIIPGWGNIANWSLQEKKSIEDPSLQLKIFFCRFWYLLTIISVCPKKGLGITFFWGHTDFLSGTSGTLIFHMCPKHVRGRGSMGHSLEQFL